MTSSVKNSRLLAAIARQPVDRTPLWIMRQAGRYLPEYRAIRAQAKDFLALCKTPDLASEITLQPTRRYALDAAILFSDILCLPEAMGLPLTFIEGKGPMFTQRIEQVSDIKKLHIPDPVTELSYVLDNVDLVKQELNGRLPLIGFSGSPWTMLCYMIEGQGGGFTRARAFLQAEPKGTHQLLDMLAQSASQYLNAQIAHGVDVVMLFDTWGSLLSRANYQQFSLRYMQQIISNLNTKTPVIVFSKGCGAWIDDIASSGCQVIGLDWTCDLAAARAQVGGRVALQGNLDPAVLLAPPPVIEKAVKQIINDFGSYPGHIFNLGHGILPETPPEALTCLIEALQRFSAR